MSKPRDHSSLAREYRVLHVKDVMEILGVGQTKAYQIMRQLNKEIEAAGYFKPVRGRVSETYFRKRFYLGEPNVVSRPQQPAKLKAV